MSYARQSNSDLRIEFARKIVDEASRLLWTNLPFLKQITLEVIETVFVPKAIAKQLAVLIALDIGLVSIHQITSLVQTIGSHVSSRSRLIRQLLTEQTIAQTQDEWMDLAERIDVIQQNDVWRSDPDCPLYERERISARIDELVHLMRRQDIFELMFVLRGSIGRSKFGLLHEGLFSKALAGTKVLVETYHNVVCAALDFCCDAPVLEGDDPVPTDARLAFFNETRHAYGRTALLLSGGAALGFYHVGVVKTLMANRLMPRVLGGSSAGSIVCAMIGTRTDEECINDLFQVKGTEAPGHSGKLAFNFFRPLKSDGSYADTSPTLANSTNGASASQRLRGERLGGLFEVWNNTAGAFKDAKRTLQGFVPIPLRHVSSLFYDLVTGNRRPQDVFKNDTVYFRKCVRANVGNFTFQEAFDRTGRILNIVVTPNNPTDPPRLLNYLTAPHVLVWSAAVASSSLPGVFEANRLVVKEADGWERYESGGRQHFSDGSMEQDLPMQQLSEMFNVNHFIISQANPHAVMFATYNTKAGVWTNSVTGAIHSIVTFLKNQVRSWLAHLVECLGARRIAPLFETERGTGTSFFTQEYEGRPSDISLIPWINHRGLLSALLHIIYNPSEAEFREWIEAAERESWKYIPAIKSHIAEEITLDLCVQRLRRRLMIESWEKDSGTKKSNVNRVPSFFTSPSLVNLSGLNVADRNTRVSVNAANHNKPATSHAEPHKPVSPLSPVSKPKKVPSLAVIPDVNINSGWAGLGLRGNRSSGNLRHDFNLAASSSVASGLFIDEDEAAAQVTQDAGEKTGTSTEALPSHPSADSFTDTKGYVKTTSMANFYYRNAAKNESMESFFGASIRKLTNDVDTEPMSLSEGRRAYRRKKSQSHTALAALQDETKQDGPS